MGAVDGELVPHERAGRPLPEHQIGVVTLVAPFVDEAAAAATAERQRDLLVILAHVAVGEVGDHGPGHDLGAGRSGQRRPIDARVPAGAYVLVTGLAQRPLDGLLTQLPPDERAQQVGEQGYHGFEPSAGDNHVDAGNAQAFTR